MAVAVFERVRRWIADPALAIDVGTATTRVSVAGRSRMLERPSVANSLEIRPTQCGRSPGGHQSSTHGQPVPALRAGVVVDCDAAAAVIGGLFRHVRWLGLIKPRVLACAPTDVSPEERSALVRALEIAGGRPMTVVPEPLAAAIGAGLDVADSHAQMVVDIGEGVTDIAVIRSGRLIHASAIRVACSDLHEAVRTLAANRYAASLSREEAARLTRVVGSIFPSALADRVPARSDRAAETDEPDLAIRRNDLWTVLDPIYASIVGQVRRTLHDLPPLVGCEVLETGICLTGGGALLRGMSDRLFAETRVATRVAEYPAHAVINGAAIMLHSGLEAKMW